MIPRPRKYKENGALRAHTVFLTPVSQQAYKRTCVKSYHITRISH